MRSSVIQSLMVLALLAAAPLARAEDEPFHGTFKLFGKEGWRALSGQVVLKGGAVAAEGRTLMTVELVRRKRALIAHSTGNERSHDNVFLVYARQIRTYYRALGYEVDVLPADGWSTILDALRAAGTSGATYTRVVTIGHGGWDGPIFSGQLSPWNAGQGWAELIAALRAGTTADAKYWVSACHAAGSDRYERAEESPWRPRDRWVDQVARASGRSCAGPAGITSTTLALRQVRAFEGAGSTAQESRLASPEGVRTVRSGGLIVNARLVPWADVEAADAAAAATN
jgi:hypothetical protein